VPFMNTLFGTAPLDLVAWASCIAVGLAVFVLVELEKLFVRKGMHPLAGTSRSPGRDQEGEGEEARRGQGA
jgi:hypothetical protein